MIQYKSPEWYEGHLCALRSTLYFAESEIENYEADEAKVFARWLREAIQATEEEAREAKTFS